MGTGDRREAAGCRRGHPARAEPARPGARRGPQAVADRTALSLPPRGQNTAARKERLNRLAYRVARSGRGQQHATEPDMVVLGEPCQAVGRDSKMVRSVARLVRLL